MIIELNFEKISKTVKIRQRNLEISAYKSVRNVWTYYRCTSKSGTKVFMFLPFGTTLHLKYNDRLIDGLFHSRCLDFQANEKTIVLKLALSE